MKQTVLSCNADGVERRNDVNSSCRVFDTDTFLPEYNLLISRIKENSNPLVMAMYSLLS